MQVTATANTEQVPVTNNQHQINIKNNLDNQQQQQQRGRNLDEEVKNSLKFLPFKFSLDSVCAFHFIQTPTE